jgi:adenine phosphoribosyltransferase
MNSLEETKIKLLAVDCLKAMKQQKTFRKLSAELKLPAGVLNRYINGYVLPKANRAAQLIAVFKTDYLMKLLESSKINGSKYIVTSEILSQPFLLNVVACQGVKDAGKASVVLTAAVDGIPLAEAIANLLGIRAVYAKHTREVSFSDHYISKGSADRPISSPFYLSKSLLKKNDSVLIVDDVVRAGTTFDALTSICTQAKASISGIFAIFITPSALKELRKRHNVSYLMLAEE